MNIDKKYVFFTPRICNMGGAENYINSKKQWLEENGWVVDVIFYDDGPVFLKNVKDCHNRFDELEYPTFYYTKRKQQTTAKRIAKVINNRHYLQLIFESSDIVRALWAELVAKECNARHLYYDLQEFHNISNPYIADFVVFKFNRHELAGIGKNSMHELMGQCGIDVPIGDKFRLLAYNNRPIADFDHPLIDEIKNLPHDYIVGSIGRLEKPFVIPSIKSFLEYAKIDSDHKYILLLIGDCSPGYNNRKQIEELCSKVDNVRLIITGFIAPIPTCLIELCDMCFSCAGSASVSKMRGVPTVSIDVTDLLPIGVLGYTTVNSLNRQDEPVLPLSYYFDIILKKHKYVKSNPDVQAPVTYISHFEYLEKAAAECEYYDMKRVTWPKGVFASKTLMPIIGPKRYFELQSKLKK